MRVQENIEKLLKKHLNPSHLEVINSSQSHEGHINDGHQGLKNLKETHFKVIIASEKFKDKSKIMRHREVYQALELCFKEGLHSLVIEDHLNY